MLDKMFIIFFIGLIVLNLIKVIVTFIKRVKKGNSAEPGCADSLAKVFNLERCTPAAATNRVIRKVAGIPDSLRGQISGYHMTVDFEYIEDGNENRHLIPKITLFVPQDKTYYFNIKKQSLLMQNGEEALKTCCPDFDKRYALSGIKSYHTAAYLNENIRKLLIGYYKKGTVEFAEGRLSLTLKELTQERWIKAVHDMWTLIDHLTSNLDILRALSDILLTDSSEGVRVNAMVQLKKMGLLYNLEEHLHSLSDNPNLEIAVLAAGELGREKIWRLIEILKKDSANESYFRIDPPYIAADYLKEYLDDRRVSDAFYRIFDDNKLASKVNRDTRYGFILQLLAEKAHKQSIPHITESLPRLSGHLKKNSPFKKALLNYLDVLEVKESNDWLLKELDNSSSEEKLTIIKLLGKLNQSTSLPQLERYSKSPLASKEIREAALLALGEIY